MIHASSLVMTLVTTVTCPQPPPPLGFPLRPGSDNDDDPVLEGTVTISHYASCRAPDEAERRFSLSTEKIAITRGVSELRSHEYVVDRDDVDDDQPELRHVGWVVHVPQPYVEPHTRCIFRGWRPRGGRRR